LFACTWIAFLVWLLIRDQNPPKLNAEITVERVGLVVLATALTWVTLRLVRLERRVK
jgi:hypothetical protein